MTWGAAASTASVATIVNRVKVIRHSLQQTCNLCLTMFYNTLRRCIGLSSDCGHKDFDWQADLRIFAQSSFGELFKQLHSPFCSEYHKTWHTCLHDICPTLAICLAINFLLCTHPTYTHHHHQAGRGGQGAKPKPDS